MRNMHLIYSNGESVSQLYEAIPASWIEISSFQKEKKRGVFKLITMYLHYQIDSDIHLNLSYM